MKVIEKHHHSFNDFYILKDLNHKSRKSRCLSSIIMFLKTSNPFKMFKTTILKCYKF